MDGHYLAFVAAVASLFGWSNCLNATEPSTNGTFMPPIDNTTAWFNFTVGENETSSVTDIPPRITVSDLPETRETMSTNVIPSVSNTIAITTSTSSGIRTSSNLSTARAPSPSPGVARSSPLMSAFSSLSTFNPAASSQPTPNSAQHSTSATPSAPTSSSSSSAPRTGTLNLLLFSTLNPSQPRSNISTELPETASTITDNTNPADAINSTTVSTQGNQTSRLRLPGVVTNRIVSRTSSDKTTRYTTRVPEDERTFKDPRAGQVMSTGEKLTTGIMAGIGVLALLCIGLGVCALSAKTNERTTKVHPIGGNKTLVSNDNGGVVAIT
ncbi:uncharacterized protein LOC144860142 [Branchiostoma floridae x Branchiostoma japonicum]